MIKELYMQFSNCVQVKGFCRSAIYDLQRNRYILIPNFFAELLYDQENKIDLTSFDTEDIDYFDSLVNDEWGIYTTKSVSSLFPKLSLEWYHYSLITNAQIDLYNNKDSILKLVDIVPQFETLGCKHFQINFLEIISYEEILQFINIFEDTEVQSICLTIPFQFFSNDQVKTLLECQPRLHGIVFYNTPMDFTPQNIMNKISFTTNDLNSRTENKISPSYFTRNILVFSESQKHNTYYNRKISIDANGYIKNSSEHEISFGNISDTPLSEAIETDGFKKYWFVHKEVIDVCKDCEFRHMCVDSAIPIKRANNSWYRSSECNYNPYISKWKHEEGYKTLKECGIEVNKQEFKIDYEKIANINAEVWAE